MINSTLLFLIKKDYRDKISSICLGMKKRGFGMGKWNGVGGKVKEGENIETATKRETLEEIGVQINKLKKVAEIDFLFSKNESWNQTVHIFLSEDWSGDIIETEEMKPEWFNIDEIPYEKMWADDKFWLPRVINGENLKGYFEFGENEEILKQKLESVPDFK